MMLKKAPTVFSARKDPQRAQRYACDFVPPAVLLMNRGVLMRCGGVAVMDDPFEHREGAMNLLLWRSQ